LNILLIQLRRLGDLILTTPVIVALRRELPEARIVLVVTPECEALLPAIPGIEPVVARRAWHDFVSWKKIRSAGFNVAVDFTRNDRSAWFTLLSGASQRIVSDRIRRKAPLRALVYNRFVDCAMKEMHTVDYHLRLLQPLGISDAPRDPVVALPSAAEQRATAIIGREIGNKKFAVFHAGAARREKFWEPERWARVIEFAAEEVVPVLSGGNDPLEQEHARAIRANVRVPIVDLTAKLDLLTLAALIGRARLLVTVDSGPMHLATAMKTPQVILFGPTNPFHWRPLNSYAAILFGPSAEPVSQFHPREPKRPMNQISTPPVIDAIRSMLSAPAASAV